MSHPMSETQARQHPPGHLAPRVRGDQVRVGDRVNFGYPQLGYEEVVAIEDGSASPWTGRVRVAVLADGTRRALFASQRSYGVDG